MMLRHGKLEDGMLEFSAPGRPTAPVAEFACAA
jgi:hypothetical protein